MNSTIFNLTAVSVIAVLIVLVAGLLTMARGSNPNLSQTLMRWRVGLQFAAVVVIMAALFVSQQG